MKKVIDDKVDVGMDFGPIFEEWEADFGRTFVIGNDPYKLKLKNDIEKAWYEGKQFFESHERITGSQLSHHCKKLAIDHGWTFGGEIAGHIIGNYPHEKLENEDKRNYIHSLNHVEMHEKNLKGEKRNWILEIHFVDSANEILKKAFTTKIIPYKPPKDKIGIPEKSLNPKENTLRH